MTQPEDFDDLVADLLVAQKELCAELTALCAEADAVLGAVPATGRTQTSGPVWQLRVRCVHVCQLISEHNSDSAERFLPELRTMGAPAAADRLTADHVALADLVCAVDQSATALVRLDRYDERERLAEALDRLEPALWGHISREQHELSQLRLERYQL